MKSFFDLSDKLNLSEAIDPYSPQALGRKKTNMLRALALDNSSFERWVHDRIVRTAERNQIPLPQLNSSLFQGAFREWESNFQQSDPNFEQHRQEFQQYVSRFMSVAPGIIAQFQAGQAAPVREPMSPPMAKYEAEGDQAQAQAAQDGEQQQLPPQYARAPEPQGEEEVKRIQQSIMSMIDVSDSPELNMSDEDIASSNAKIGAEVRKLASDIAQANQVDETQISYDMMNDYLKSVRDNASSDVIGVTDDEISLDDNDLDYYEALVKQEFARQYGLVQPFKEIEERARLKAQQQINKAALETKNVTKIQAEHAEAGLLLSLEKLLNVPIVSSKDKTKIATSLAKIKDEKVKQQVQAYFDIQAQSLMEKYGTFLQGASFKHFGRTKGKLSDVWAEKGSTQASSKTTKTDIQITLAEGTYIRFDDAKNAYVRCSAREVMEGAGCTNVLNISVKKGDSQLMSGKDKETDATIFVALQNLTDQGFNFNDAKNLAQTFMSQGADEETATQRAEQVVQTVASLKDLSKKFVEGRTAKGQINMYQAGGIYRNMPDAGMQNTQELIDSAQSFVSDVENMTETLIQSMPEVLGEMAYIAATGEGKFQAKKEGQGIDEIATHFLTLSNVDPATGPKLIPITRKFMYDVAKSGKMRTFVAFKSNSLASMKKKMTKQYEQEFANQGLEGDVLDAAVRRKLDENVPYTFSTVLRMIMNETVGQNENQEVQESTVKSIGYFLKEQKQEEVFDNVPGVSNETKKYTKEAFNWAYSNLDNMVQFFEMKPQVGDVNLPDISDDFGDTYFKKSIDDEANELNLDML